MPGLAGGPILAADKKKGKRDIAETAWQPDGDEQEYKENRILVPHNRYAERHYHMKKRGPGA